MIGLGVLFALATQPACERVVEDVETVAISGTLEDRGDWVALRPDPPACFDLASTPTPYDEARRYEVLDVFFSGGAARYDVVFGAPVVVSGTLVGAHTEEHNADLLIVVQDPADIVRTDRQEEAR